MRTRWVPAARRAAARHASAVPTTPFEVPLHYPGAGSPVVLRGCRTSPGRAASAGVTCFFVHGAGGSRRVWDKVVSLLAGSIETVAVDLPSHGESDCPMAAGAAPGACLNPRALAAAVCLMAGRTVDAGGPVVYVGGGAGCDALLHAWGGLPVAAAAVLVGGPSCGALKGAAGELASHAAEWAGEGREEPAAEEDGGGSEGDPAEAFVASLLARPKLMMDPLLAADARRAAPALPHLAAAAWAQPPPLPEGAQCTAVVGEEDAACGDAARSYAAAAGGVDLTVAAGAGHLVMWEQPHQVAAAVLAAVRDALARKQRRMAAIKTATPGVRELAGRGLG
eukprot:TRINITY_DN7373_c0_g1_i1.p1 TRINITY_DN7373_c0_g1~~TRINITY_DN7373_c0_g1_i1.p1  ORF type:complete len:337 (+),score=74.09 TRINITY_DN7373_c0_g1_i1:77-1087(+)